MVKNDNGYSLQPGLMDKMYDDRKEDNKKKEREKKISERKKERENKRLKKEKDRKQKAEKAKKDKKKKEKEKPLTPKQKLGYTVVILLSVPLIQLFFIYYQGSWLDIILKSTKNSKFLKEYLPDGEGVPYSKGEQGSSIKCKEIKALLPQGKTYTKSNPQQPIDGVSAPRKMANPQEGAGRKKKRKRHIQKGGFNKAMNDAKDFFNSTKYGMPYSMIENDNFLMNGIGEYFKTFWQYQRTAIKMLLETVNESLFKEHKEPTNLGEQIYDVFKFVFVIPLVSMVAHMGQYFTSTILLFWAAFNNQTLLIIPFFITALCCIFFGAFTGFFWPWGLFSNYLIAFSLRPNQQKLDHFINYGKKYKWLWCISILISWSIGIGSIWDWQRDAMIFIGVLWGLIGAGMLGITRLV